MITIALDGPSGAGKSTVCSMVAKSLDILHLNTGALYRAVGYYLIENGIDQYNKEAVIDALPNMDIDIEYIDGKQHVITNGVDVTDKLYSMQVSDVCSISSAYPEVRKYIVSLQQKVANKSSVIMEGRDITSEVLPNAKYKFYLDASSSVRALRRINDSKNSDKLTMDDYNRIKDEIEERDRRDKTRETSPLVQTVDSYYINSDNMDATEVANIVISMVKEGERNEKSN